MILILLQLESSSIAMLNGILILKITTQTQTLVNRTRVCLPAEVFPIRAGMNAIIPVMKIITFCLPTGGGSTAMTCRDAPSERIGY